MEGKRLKLMDRFNVSSSMWTRQRSWVCCLQGPGINETVFPSWERKWRSAKNLRFHLDKRLDRKCNTDPVHKKGYSWGSLGPSARCCMSSKSMLWREQSHLQSFLVEAASKPDCSGVCGAECEESNNHRVPQINTNHNRRSVLPSYSHLLYNDS